MNRIILILIALLSLSVGMAQDMSQLMQPLPLDPETRHGTLPNGLTYYIRHNERPQGQANFYIAQKVGSVLEEDDQRGLAHFLEHICFNGTKNFPGNEVIRYLESIGVKFGAQLNAYTSVDETVYNINNVPTQREETIDSVLLILHDWSHDLTLDPEEIDKERGVIHEEWRLRSSALMRIFERQLPRLMSNSRPGNRLPIGLMEVVDSFKPEALRAYYEKWYRPDLQAIIVVGDLDVDRTEQSIKDLFGPIPMPENPAERVYYDVPDNEEAIVVSDSDKEQTLPIVMIAYKHEDLMPGEQKNSYAYMLASYVRDMALNMLNERLDELSLDPDVPFIKAEIDDDDFALSKVTKALQTEIMPKEGRMYEAITEVMGEVYRAAEHGFIQTEYERARSEFLSKMEALYDNRLTTETSSYISECVQHFLDHEPMPGIEAEHAFYNAVAPSIPLEAVNAMFAEMVSRTDHNLVLLCINPLKEGYEQPSEEALLEAVHKAQAMDTEAYEDNVRLEPLIPSLPPKGEITEEAEGMYGTTILRLSNGARVIYKQTDFKDNEIVMNAFSPGGSSRYGVEDKYTLRLSSALTGVSGLGEFTSTELQKALAGKQVGVTSSIGSREEHLSGSAVPKDLRTLFELVYLHFQPLKQDDKAASSVMEQTALALRNQAADPMKAFTDTLQTLLYGDDPHLVLLREEDLDKVSYPRALEIYEDRFADASDFTFCFAGSFSVDSLRLLSEQYLATLPSLERDDTPADNGFNLRDGVLENVFPKRQEQPKCILASLMHCPIEDTPESELVADALGQVLTMRLLEVVREDMGAAYSIGAAGGVSERSDGSSQVTLQLIAPIKPETLDTCRAVIASELQSLADNGTEQKYLSKVKEYLLKTYRENQRDNSAWLQYIEGYYLKGIDRETGFESLLERLSSADVQALAQQLLSSGNQATVVMLPEE
ncbi:MAG: insulinase family protein [Prevotellaceae bacterium]|nr:insulinase family protein [Prevotellaceae bacterium]